MTTHTLFRRIVTAGAVTSILTGLGIGTADAETVPAAFAPQSGSACHIAILSYGSTGHLVTVVQRRLGHIAADGSFGPATLRAVKTFQGHHHLARDGHVGPKTWNALGGYPGCGSTGPSHHAKKYPTLRYGDTGSAVKRAQRLLNKDLPGHIAVDGSFGPATSAATKRFERSQGDMVVNGVIGMATWKRLEHPHKSKPKPPKKPSKPAVTGWVASTDHAVNVRSGPGFGHRVVGHKAKGQRVRARSANKHWLKISGGHYINKGVLEYKTSNLRAINGRGPGHLCGIPHKYNSPDSFAPGYTKKRTRYLNCHALTALKALERAYHQHYGKYALIDLAYRTYKEQQYWFDKLGYPRAAYPGTSNHGLGEAIDFTSRHQAHFGWGQYGNTWLLKHAGRYGFANPFIYGRNGESYHFNFVG